MKDEPGTFESPAMVNWTGFYIGVHGGYGNANHELTVDKSYKTEGGTDTFNWLDLDGINSRGFIGGVNGGLDLSRGGWVFGVLGGYSFTNMESSLSVADGAAKWTLSKQDEWYVGGRVGRVVAPRTLVYLLAAYTQTEYELSGTGIDDKPSQTYSGIKAGVGGEFALTNNIFLGMEYTHDFYGKQDWINEDGFKVSDSLDEDKIMATLKFKLNGGLGRFAD